jgi:hypothetical protein
MVKKRAMHLYTIDNIINNSLNILVVGGKQRATVLDTKFLCSIYHRIKISLIYLKGLGDN